MASSDSLEYNRGEREGWSEKAREGGREREREGESEGGRERDMVNSTISVVCSLH